MSNVRDPDTDQQLPEPGKTAIHQLLIDSLEAWGVGNAEEQRVIADGLVARRELGVQKYGRPLESHNGRDAMQDCWEELLDSSVYAVQMELEGIRVGDVILVLVQILRRLAREKINRGD